MTNVRTPHTPRRKARRGERSSRISTSVRAAGASRENRRKCRVSGRNSIEPQERDELTTDAFRARRERRLDQIVQLTPPVGVERGRLRHHRLGHRAKGRPHGGQHQSAHALSSGSTGSPGSRPEATGPPVRQQHAHAYAGPRRDVRRTPASPDAIPTCRVGRFAACHEIPLRSFQSRSRGVPLMPPIQSTAWRSIARYLPTPSHQRPRWATASRPLASPCRRWCRPSRARSTSPKGSRSDTRYAPA